MKWVKPNTLKKFSCFKNEGLWDELAMKALFILLFYMKKGTWWTWTFSFHMQKMKLVSQNVLVVPSRTSLCTLLLLLCWGFSCCLEHNYQWDVFFRWLRNQQKPYELSSATSAATARTTQTCQTASRSDAPSVQLTDGGSISTPERWESHDTLMLRVGTNWTRTTSPWRQNLKDNSWSSEWKCTNCTLHPHIIYWTSICYRTCFCLPSVYSILTCTEC